MRAPDLGGVECRCFDPGIIGSLDPHAIAAMLGLPPAQTRVTQVVNLLRQAEPLWSTLPVER